MEIRWDDPEAQEGADLFRALVGATIAIRDNEDLKRAAEDLLTAAAGHPDPLKVLAHSLMSARQLLLGLLAVAAVESSDQDDDPRRAGHAIWLDVVSRFPYPPT